MRSMTRKNERKFTVKDTEWRFWPDFEKGKIGVKKGNREATHAEPKKAIRVCKAILHRQSDAKTKEVTDTLLDFAKKIKDEETDKGNNR